MNLKFFTYVVILNIILVNLNGVLSHNWLSWPVSRGNQRQSQTGCRFGGEGNPTCGGPCDRTKSQATIKPVIISRGDSLAINWNRHMHPGGFIRFAWTSTDDSDDHSSFDNGVDRFVCKEIGGCGPVSLSDPAGEPNGKECGTTITVPSYLTDGKWTLQWAYFGGYFNAGDYYACVDYIISGGPTGTQQAPFFIGGDFSNPNSNVCTFYSTNALHVCKVEPCTTGTFSSGAHIGKPLGFDTSTPPKPLTTGAPKPVTTAAPKPVTTAAPKPVTTAAPKPVTTANPPPVTTAAMKPVTTAAPKPVTTSTPPPVTTSTPPPVTTKRYVPLTTGNPPPVTTAAPPPVTTKAFIPATTGRKSSTSTTGPVVTNPESPSPGQECLNLGNEVCASSNTYLSCYRATVNSYQWSGPRPCQPGLVCKPWMDNNHVICDRP